MVKIVGAALVIIACGAMGIVKSQELKQRQKELYLVKRMLLLLRGEIKYSRTPLPEAFINIGKRMGGELGGFLTGVGEQLEKQEGRPFSDVWKQAVNKDLCGTKLNKEDKEQLKRMGENLGYLDGEMQMNIIELQLEQVETQLERLEQSMAGKTRVYNCVGIFSGLLIAIVLL